MHPAGSQAGGPGQVDADGELKGSSFRVGMCYRGDPGTAEQAVKSISGTNGGWMVQLVRVQSALTVGPEGRL